MWTDITPPIACGLLLAITLLGGFLPLWARTSERQLHIALALATGFFLGAVFLHLLPTLALEVGDLTTHADDGVAVAHSPAEHAGEGLASHSHPSVQQAGIWLSVLFGVLGIYLVESLVLRSHDFDELHRHRAVAFASLIGLGLHSITTGIGYAAASAHGGLTGPILTAILAHKGFEAFSLTSVFQLASFTRPKLFALVVGFSLITPLGVVLGRTVLDGVSETVGLHMTALAAGTFLFVCLSELLPEVFHHREDVAAKIALLATGVGVMWALGMAGA